MSGFVVRLSTFVVATVFCLSSATRAVASAPLQAGDPFVVAQRETPLMRGNRTLATLPQGQRFNVLRTEGEWVGTRAVVNGQTVGGWVHKSHVATPAQYAQRRTTRRRYSYQAGAAEGGFDYPSAGYSGGYSGRRRSGSTLDSRFIMGYTPYGPSYWRADRKIKGY